MQAYQPRDIHLTPFPSTTSVPTRPTLGTGGSNRPHPNDRRSLPSTQFAQNPPIPRTSLPNTITPQGITTTTGTEPNATLRGIYAQNTTRNRMNSVLGLGLNERGEVENEDKDTDEVIARPVQRRSGWGTPYARRPSPPPPGGIAVRALGGKTPLPSGGTTPLPTGARMPAPTGMRTPMHSGNMTPIPNYGGRTPMPDHGSRMPMSVHGGQMPLPSYGGRTPLPAARLGGGGRTPIPTYQGGLRTPNPYRSTTPPPYPGRGPARKGAFEGIEFHLPDVYAAVLSPMMKLIFVSPSILPCSNRADCTRMVEALSYRSIERGILFCPFRKVSSRLRLRKWK
jgi:hypothetical protein